MPHSTLPLRGLEPSLFMRSPAPNAIESEEDKAYLCATPYHLYSVRYMTAIAPNLAPQFQDIFADFRYRRILSRWRSLANGHLTRKFVRNRALSIDPGRRITPHDDQIQRSVDPIAPVIPRRRTKRTQTRLPVSSTSPLLTIRGL